MNDNAPAEPPFDLNPGLWEYYTSQAELMLTQYKNINRLLGRTDDWTHPGDLCEILLRTFLRTFLPAFLSVDKGYFYGRATFQGKNTHCPEIDLLIHDTRAYSPLFRMGDFVIVQPQAVCGMIQVKRTFSTGQVREGIRNIVTAKQLLLDVIWRDNPRGWNNDPIAPQVFTAVLGFKDEITHHVQCYHRWLLDWHIHCRSYDRPNQQETSMYVLPSFIGTLEGSFIMWPRACNFDNQRYLLYNSQHRSEVNVFLQALLAGICTVMGSPVVGHPLVKSPPLAFPPDVRPYCHFPVLCITKAKYNSNPTVITINRNDGAKGHYQKKAGDPDRNDIVHLIRKRSSLTVLPSLLPATTPPVLYVERGNTLEQYNLTKWEPASKPKSRRNPKPRRKRKS